MIAPDALAQIRLKAQTPGGVWITDHAHDRMRLRRVSVRDVYHALIGATVCRPADLGRWEVTGPDLDGVDLTIVAVIEEKAIVVTVY